MTLIIQSEAYIIGIEKALDDSERTVGSIIEPQKDGSTRVVATFNEAVASVIEQLDNKVRAAEQRVKEMEAKQQHISLKPHVYRELVNQLRDTAVKYVGCQHLREQLSRTLQYALVADSQPVSNRDELPVIGWLRSDYNSDDKRDPNAPLFMLGSNDPSETWGVKYIPLSGSSPAIPDDWVMVPKEPTQAMIKAWLSEVANFRGHAAGYKAALAAAPQREVK